MSLLVIDPYRFAAADTFVMGYRQDVMAWSSVDGSSGMTWIRAQDSSALGGGRSLQNGVGDADDGDYMEWFVNLAAGTYSLDVIITTGSDSGIHTFSVDGVDVGSVDGYSVAFTRNVVATFSSITVAADGNYTVKCRANSKNASSSDFVIRPQAVTLTRTGA